MYSAKEQKAESRVDLSENYCLKLLNLTAIFVEFISLLYVLLDSNLTDFTSISFMYHSSFLFLSVNYHLFPYLKTNFIFQFLARTLCAVSFMLLVLTVYLIIIAGGWDFFVFVFVLIFFTGPASVVSFTLLLLLDDDQKASSEVHDDMVYVAVVHPPRAYVLV